MKRFIKSAFNFTNCIFSNEVQIKSHLILFKSLVNKTVIWKS